MNQREIGNSNNSINLTLPHKFLTEIITHFLGMNYSGARLCF